MAYFHIQYLSVFLGSMHIKCKNITRKTIVIIKFIGQKKNTKGCLFGNSITILLLSFLCNISTCIYLKILILMYKNIIQKMFRAEQNFHELFDPNYCDISQV